MGWWRRMEGARKRRKVVDSHFLFAFPLRTPPKRTVKPCSHFLIYSRTKCSNSNSCVLPQLFELHDCSVYLLHPAITSDSYRELSWLPGHLHNNNINSYIALYHVNIYELAAPYIINIKIHLTIKKAQVL